MLPRGAIFAACFALCTVVLSEWAADAATKRAANGSPLRVAVEGNFPPFSEVGPNGDLIGFDVDIASALCVELKRQCEFVQQDWGGMIQNLIDGKYDVIVSSMHPTKERRKVIDFTEKYSSFPSLFAAAKGKSFVDTPLGMKGKTIGVMVGSVQDTYLWTYFRESQIRRFGLGVELYRALYYGEVDSIFHDGVAIELQFFKSAFGSGFEFFGGPHNDPVVFGEGFAIALRKNERGLRASLNEAIKTIRANGTYAAINSKYFSFDIY